VQEEEVALDKENNVFARGMYHTHDFCEVAIVNPGFPTSQWCRFPYRALAPLVSRRPIGQVPARRRFRIDPTSTLRWRFSF
jgi:hypothetical protein